MKNKSPVDYLEQQLESCCLELFRSHTQEICPTQELARIAESDPIGALDAGSEDLDLTVFLQLPFTILSATYPVEQVTSDGIGEAEMEDWIGELCNQLMGRLKHRLLKCGLSLGLGLPTVYFGAPISELLPSDGLELVKRFKIGDAVLEATLLVDILKEDLDLIERDDIDNGPPEGIIELF